MSENIKPIVMPKWGLAMLEGMLTKWHVTEGADIRPGAEICDIETSKIANAMEANVAGRLLRRIASEGATLPVGALMAVVGEGATSSAEVDAFVAKFEEDFAQAAKSAEAEEPSTRKLDVGGRQINYSKLGNSEGPPVILVHGFGADFSTWMFNQSQIAEAGFTTYALDLPGHGESDKILKEGSVAEFAQAVAGFMDALAIGKAHLVGQSLGGAIVMQLAADKPEKVASLTLISSAGLGEDINMTYIEAFMAANGRKDLKPELEKLFVDPSAISRDMINNVLKYKRMDGVADVLRTVAAASFANGKQSSVLRDKLASVRIPVQVVFGKEDQIIPASHCEGLPANVKVRVIAEASHMPHMEAAGEVNRLICEIAKG